MPANPTWPEADMAALRQLWPTGMSTADIADRLHTTKNAVVGKVHRMELTPRPSPIRRALDQGTKDRAAAMVAGGYTQIRAAQALGIDRHTVLKILQARAAASDDPPPPQPPPPPAPEPPPAVTEPPAPEPEFVFAARPEEWEDKPCWMPGCDHAAETGRAWCNRHRASVA